MFSNDLLGAQWLLGEGVCNNPDKQAPVNTCLSLVIMQYPTYVVASKPKPPDSHSRLSTQYSCHDATCCCASELIGGKPI